MEPRVKIRGSFFILIILNPDFWVFLLLFYFKYVKNILVNLVNIYYLLPHTGVIHKCCQWSIQAQSAVSTLQL